jgi:hypothetical protein
VVNVTLEVAVAERHVPLTAGLKADLRAGVEITVGGDVFLPPTKVPKLERCEAEIKHETFAAEMSDEVGDAEHRGVVAPVDPKIDRVVTLHCC